MSIVEELSEQLAGGLLERAFADRDIDDLLSGRNAREFDQAWVESNHRIEKLREEAGLSATAESAVTQVREKAFKEVYRLTEDPDLAAYVSDDFGLLATALFRDATDPWVNALWLVYASGDFPRGSLTPFPGRLVDLVLSSSSRPPT